MNELLQRPIPRTGEALPAIGLGTWQTFDVGAAESARAGPREVLRQFVEAGGRLVDSSPMYGKAETVTGDLATELGIADKLFLATKVWTSGRANGVRQMEASFRRLRTDRVDLMQVHNLVDWRTHLDTLRDWKAQGRVRYLGVSHYTERAYADVARVIRTGEIDFIQINYSVLARAAEQDLLPLAEEHRVGVIVNRPFETADLFRKVQTLSLPSWAADFDCTSWAQYFLKFVLSHPAVTCIIPATHDPMHELDNLRAGHGRLPDRRQRERMARHLEHQ